MGKYVLINDDGADTPRCNTFWPEAKKSGRLVAVFAQAGCGPCREYIEELSHIGEIPGTDFAVVDVEECPAVASQSGIDKVPSIVVFSHGRVTERAELTGDAKADVSALARSLIQDAGGRHG